MLRLKLSSLGVQKLLLGILFIGSFTLIFLLNNNYPIYADDWIYYFIFGQEEPVKIGGVSDIVISQYNHYILWGGRSVVHIIAQILLTLDSLLRAILNSLVYVLFTLLIYKISNKRNAYSPILYAVLFFMIWLSIPYFPQTVLWTTGNANYLWGTTIVLLFLYPFYSYYIDGKAKDSNFIRCFSFIAGIVAGWTNENIAVTFIFLLIVLLLYLKLTNKQIPRWMIFGFVGSVIGCSIMLLAPGNFVRSAGTNQFLSLDDKSLAEVLLFKLRNVYLIYKNLDQIKLLIILYICLFAGQFLLQKQNIDKKKRYGSLLFFIAAHISALVMLGSPIFPPRAAFCTVTFLIIANGILLSEFNCNKYQKISTGTICLVLLLFFIPSYKALYANVDMFKDRVNEREAIIRESVNKDNFNIIFKKGISLPSFFDYEDLSVDASDWRNKAFSNYYEIESVRLIIDDEKK